MRAQVTWKNGLSFEASADTGFTLPLGADSSVGGANDGFRPLELMAVSLAGCTAMDVISILRKKQQQVTGFEVKVHADQQGEHPHVFTQAVIEYHLRGQALEEAALRRAIELSALKYCPAQAMLSRVFPISLQYFIYDLQGALLLQGEWQPPQ